MSAGSGGSFNPIWRCWYDQPAQEHSSIGESPASNYCQGAGLYYSSIESVGNTYTDYFNNIFSTKQSQAFFIRPKLNLKSLTGPLNGSGILY